MNEKYFVHENGLCESSDIGENTRIWAYTHIMKGASIGSNCNVGSHCFIENGVIIGNDITIKNGISIWDGVRIDDRVFLGPHMVFTNNLMPRSKAYDYELLKTRIKYCASIGANATILCGIIIGKYSMIGAGSVITKDVPDYALVYGNPGRIKGFVCECGEKLEFINSKVTCLKCELTYSIINNECMKEK